MLSIGSKKGAYGINLRHGVRKNFLFFAFFISQHHCKTKPDRKVAMPAISVILDVELV